MKYELNIYHRNTPDQELLDDLKKVADRIEIDKVTMAQYDQKGKFNSRTLIKRFGAWNKALEKAGLKITVKQNLSEKNYSKILKKYGLSLDDNLYIRK